MINAKDANEIATQAAKFRAAKLGVAVAKRYKIEASIYAAANKGESFVSRNVDNKTDAKVLIAYLESLGYNASLIGHKIPCVIIEW